MRDLFSVEELQTAELSEPFSFTKGCKLMKIDALTGGSRDYHRACAG